MDTKTYSVPGITCDHCKMAIEGEVSQLAGVDSVNVDVSTKSVQVSGEATDEDIRAAIEEAGFDTVLAGG